MTDDAKPAAAAEVATSGLTAVLVLATPLITGIGLLTLTGTVGRVQRNEAEVFAWGIGLVLAAGALWLLSDVWKNPGSEKVLIGSLTVSKAFKVFAVGLALLGTILGFVSAVSTADDQARPRIEATVSENGRKLDATVRVSQLKTEDRVAIYAEGLVDTRIGWKLKRPVYQAFVGPNSDGDVEHKLSIRLPKGRYDSIGVRAYSDRVAGPCVDLSNQDPVNDAREAKANGTACVVMPLTAK